LNDAHVLCSSRANVHLQSLCIRDTHDSTRKIDWIQTFFEQHAPSLKTIGINLLYNKVTLFASLHTLLENLETVTLTYVTNQIRLNDLKDLSKLKCLVLNLEITKRNKCYNLDVGELITLTELHISSYTTSIMCESGPKIRIVSRGLPPLDAMEKFKIAYTELDFEALEKITRIMPNLKELVLVRTLCMYILIMMQSSTTRIVLERFLILLTVIVWVSDTRRHFLLQIPILSMQVRKATIQDYEKKYF
jgi:hypothetical protein